MFPAEFKKIEVKIGKVPARVIPEYFTQVVFQGLEFMQSQALFESDRARYPECQVFAEELSMTPDPNSKTGE